MVNNMLQPETRRKLVEAMGTNLPPELKEDQALWWIRPEHSAYLTIALENLAKVSVNPGRPAKVR